MLRFFRRIRQQLLTAGSLRKYLLYAVGEVVLVVIGILIALQINTWNEERKRRQLKASYTESLINDLSQDTLMLARLIDENTKELHSLELQQRRFLGPETPIDTLIRIVRYEFEPELNTRFQYHRNTLNTLVASGNIDLFSKEFNEMLMGLISMQDIERENSNYYMEIYSGKVSRFSDHFPVSGHKNSRIINAIWADADRGKLAPGFISLTDIKGYAHYTFVQEVEKIKAETTLILKALKAAF